ncbi:MAG: hypothetical protein ACOWWM_09625 [Desulfobacterales bacterium]
MTRSEIEKILEHGSEDERVRITTLYNASITTLKTYQDDNSRANLQNWQAAEDALTKAVDVVRDRIWPTEPVLKDRKAALGWLKEQGYKISVGKFYQDCGKGLCVVGQDGTIRESALIAYSSQYLKRIETEGGDSDPLQKQKLEVEIRRQLIKEQEDQLRLEKEQGKWLLRSDFSRELAARAGVLEQGLKNFLRTRMTDVVGMCGGDQAKLQTAIDFCLAELDVMLTEYATMDRFHVIFEEQS